MSARCVGTVLAALALAGCGVPLVVDPAKVVPAPCRTEEAVAHVVKFFGLRHVPQIVWYGGAALDCGDAGYTGAVGACVDGEQDGDLIILSDKNGLPIHETGLAHELGGHHASDERGEGGDAAHAGHFFRNPGDDLSKDFDRTHGLVGEENRRLAEAGY